MAGGLGSPALAGQVGTSATQIQGNVASAATDSGNPVKTGGVYNTSRPTLTTGQRGDTQMDTSANTSIFEWFAPTAERNSTPTPNSLTGVYAVVRPPYTGADYSPTSYQGLSDVTKAVIKASSGNVFMIRVTNDNAAVRYFQLHNKATAPAAADTPVLWWKVSAGTATAPGILQLDRNYFCDSHWFSTGIGWSISTTNTTFTDSATASEHIVHVRYF